ncbi:hypothetical protein Dsin_020673 [Dipteronia sinensis]|uniref:Uncharacterized protein n=1 Tax=Dipteronia sinensis TaxID=43782 RepID=A0AAE0A9P5_9ROSI|nr:hypothetical protein Dsin_020673 [Dipteronia sinensis]
MAKLASKMFSFKKSKVAGQVHDDFSIVCDDTGATFIEAKVSGDVSDILKRPQNEEFGNQTTRFQALAALVWGAVISAKRATNPEYEPNAMSIATPPINLRKKTDSVSAPIPDQCIGNIISPAIAFCPIKDTVDYKILATKLQESYMESVKKTSADGSRLLRGRGTNFHFIILICDFGWGKPIWVTIVRPEYNDSAVFFVTRDGKGIELWIQLPEQDMALFEQDPTILAYASFNPSVSV